MTVEAGRCKGVSDVVANLLLVVVIAIFSYFIVSMFLGVMTSGRERVVEESYESMATLRQTLTVLASYIDGDGNLVLIVSTGPVPVTLYGVIYGSNIAETLYVNNKPYTITSSGIKLNASSIYVVKVPLQQDISETRVVIVYGGGVYEVYAKKIQG